VQQVAQELGINSPKGAYLVAESVGNNTRQLYSELEKLRTLLVQLTNLDVDSVATGTTNTQNSLHLAAAIRVGMQPRHWR